MAKRDSLLAHCIARAIIAEAGGLVSARDRWGDDAAGFRAEGAWRQIRLLAKVTPKASRVAAFIVMWAWQMRDESKDALTITEFQRYWNEGERQAYRHQAEFRELWSEVDTPNELARQVVPHLGAKLDARKLPTTVPVLA